LLEFPLKSGQEENRQSEGGKEEALKKSAWKPIRET